MKSISKRHIKRGFFLWHFDERLQFIGHFLFQQLAQLSEIEVCFCGKKKHLTSFCVVDNHGQIHDIANITNHNLDVHALRFHHEQVIEIRSK